jgi:acyl-CoA-binding protein
MEIEGNNAIIKDKPLLDNLNNKFEKEKEEEEEEACCRVCHCEGDNQNPLYHPCKCDGSIKFVHQDCLKQWLKISNRQNKKCELCGEEYQFRSIYQNGEIPSLSFFEFCHGLLPRVIEFIKNVIHLFSFIFFWLFLLPIVTTSFSLIYSNIIYQEDILTLLNINTIASSFSHLLASWWIGILNTLFIIFASLGISQFLDVIHKEFARARARANLIHAQAILRTTVAELIEANHVQLEENNENLGVNQIGVINNINDNNDINNNNIEPIIVLRNNNININNGVDNNNDVNLDQFDNIIDENANPRDDDDALLVVDNNLNILKCLKFMIYNGIFLFCFEVIPVYIGKFVIYNIFGGLSKEFETQLKIIFSKFLDNNNNADILNELMHRFHFSDKDIVLNENIFWLHFCVLLQGIIGLIVVISLLIILYIVYFIYTYEWGRKNQPGSNVCLVDILKTQYLTYRESFNVWSKITFVLSIEGTLLPQLLGWLIDIVTIKSFPNSTANDRFNMLYSNPILCIIIHWIIGFVYMLYISIFLVELRDCLRADLLVEILPQVSIQELDDHSLKSLGKKPIMYIITRTLINICFYLFGILITFFIPFIFGHHLSPCSNKLKLQFKEIISDVQFPVEMVIFHIVLPLLLEKLHLRKFIRSILKKFLAWGCEYFEIISILNTRSFDDYPGLIREEELPIVNGDEIAIINEIPIINEDEIPIINEELPLNDITINDNFDSNNEMEDIFNSKEEKEIQINSLSNVTTISVENQFLSAQKLFKHGPKIKEPSNDIKLKIYGLFKQGSVGPCDGSIKVPGNFDLIGRSKYNSWKSYQDMSKEEAMKEYINLINSLMPTEVESKDFIINSVFKELNIDCNELNVQNIEHLHQQQQQLNDDTTDYTFKLSDLEEDEDIKNNEEIIVNNESLDRNIFSDSILIDSIFENEEENKIFSDVFFDDDDDNDDECTWKWNEEDANVDLLTEVLEKKEEVLVNEEIDLFDETKSDDISNLIKENNEIIVHEELINEKELMILKDLKEETKEETIELSNQINQLQFIDDNKKKKIIEENIRNEECMKRYNINPIVDNTINQNDYKDEEVNLFEMKNISINVRFSLLIFMGILALSIISSWAIHYPLAVGRSLLSSIKFQIDHDLYNLAAGYSVCWCFSFFYKYLSQNAIKNSIIAIKVLFLGRYCLLFILIFFDIYF